MEHGTDTANTVYKRGSRNNSDRIVEQRLAHLLRLNADVARQKALFPDEGQRLRALVMTRPMDSRQVFGYLGLMIGSLPPLALVVKILISNRVHAATGLLLLIAAAGMVAGVVALKLGRRYVPGALRSVSGFSIPNRIALWAVIGFFWGAISGAAGGLVIFLIGSIFAAIAGGIVGAIVVPVMVAVHSTVRAGDLIETKHFLPLTFGVTLSVCAFLLGS